MIETRKQRGKIGRGQCIRRHYKWLKQSCFWVFVQNIILVLEDTISDWNAAIKNTIPSTITSIRRHYKWLKLILRLLKWQELKPVLEDTISDWNLLSSAHFRAAINVLEDTISDWNKVYVCGVWRVNGGIRRHYKWLKLKIYL